jgi:cytochrome c biogenesis protein CcdA
MLLLSLIGIAVLDSLNPSIILLTLYLLSTQNPIKRTATYIAGVFLTSWTLGLLVYFGLGAAFSAILSNVFNATAWWVYGLELVAALVLIYFSVTMKTTSDAKLKKKPKNINPKSTFALGVGATFIEFSTAAPYLAAIAVLIKAEPSALYAILSLGIYNVIYIGIPLIFFGIYLAKRDKAKPILANLNEKVSHYMRKVAKVLFFFVGLILLADFIAYLFGSPFLG